jgi:predicted DNA-binding transcriptional regulator AlpA
MPLPDDDFADVESAISRLMIKTWPEVPVDHWSPESRSLVADELLSTLLKRAWPRLSRRSWDQNDLAWSSVRSEAPIHAQSETFQNSARQATEDAIITRKIDVEYVRRFGAHPEVETAALVPVSASPHVSTVETKKPVKRVELPTPPESQTAPGTDLPMFDLLERLRLCTEPLTRKELAKLLKLSTKTIKRWMDDGLPSFPAGKRRKFDPRTVRWWYIRYNPQMARAAGF